MKNHIVKKIITSLVGLSILSSLYYYLSEGWTIIDSLFFTILTITTVGHPDLAIISTTSKIVTSVVAIIGISLFLTLFGILASYYVESKQNNY